jgi:hypothetical protein
MNRTNGRFYKFALRLGFASLAPRLAEKIALQHWMTPQLRGPSCVPNVPGLMTFHRTIVTGAHQLAAWEWGQGPAVLLVHDWNGQASDLESFVTPLVDAGYRVVAADLPAHGRSSGRTAGIADWRRAVTAMARYAGPVQGVIAAGWGATVTLLAAQEGAPLRRLTLLSPRQSVLHDMHGQALALGFTEHELPALLREFEAEQHVRLESLDLRRAAGRLALPTLILEDSRDREALVPFVVRFLQQGTLPAHAVIPHTEFQVAV